MKQLAFDLDRRRNWSTSEEQDLAFKINQVAKQTWQAWNILEHTNNDSLFKSRLDRAIALHDQMVMLHLTHINLRADFPIVIPSKTK